MCFWILLEGVKKNFLNCIFTRPKYYGILKLTVAGKQTQVVKIRLT